MFLASNKKRQSTDLEGTPNPKLGQKQNGAKTPKSGFKNQTPKSGLKMQSPKANFKPGTPKSNEKKNFSKNGARKSLAVNGSPKAEEATAVQVEAAAKSPANKNKNRKRSLSEPGAGPVAKTAKLNKFPGTASLTTDKKKQPNHSARKRTMTKDKKKQTASENKQQIKEKVLQGDIETLRDIQTKLDILIVKTPKERTNSTRRKIRWYQALLKIKANKGEDSNNASSTAAKVQKQKPGQKKSQRKGKQELVKSEQQSGENVSAGLKKTQKPAQQVIGKELKLTDDASDEEVSNAEGDSEMLSAESEEDSDAEGSDEDVAEEGSDEEDSDNDEEDSDDEEVAPEFIVDDKGQKPTQKLVSSIPQSPAQNKRKPFGKFGNKKFGNDKFGKKKFGDNKFAGRPKKGPQKNI